MNKSTFYAACTEINITPELPISLAGHLTKRIATAVKDPLFARLLMMSNGHQTVLFILLDLIGINNKDVTQLRESLHHKLQFPLANICVSSTHTHSGPTTIGSFDSEIETDYLQEILPRITDAAIQLSKQLQPAKTAWGTGYESRPQYNRRFIMKGGILKTNPGRGNPDILHPAGPIDPHFPVLIIKNNNNEIISIFASYSLHYIGSGSNDVISADYFGEFSRQIKGKYGDKCVAMLAHGLSGDINNVNAQQCPEPWFPENATAEQKSTIVAKMLVDQVDNILKETEFYGSVPIATTKSTFKQNVRRMNAEEIALFQSQATDENVPFREGVFAREKLRTSDYPDVVELPMLAWKIGGWGMVTFPGQMFAQFALDLRHISPFETITPVEIANGRGGYVGRRIDYILGGYEMQLARSSYAVAGTGEEMLCRAAEMMREIY